MPKTALELTLEEQSQYTPTQRFNNGQKSERWKEAWKLVPRLAILLREQFGATRVVVFGSLTHSAAYTAWSDIDLAAWSIPARCFYEAVGSLNEIHPGFSVDLVDPESPSCRDSVRQVIEAAGIEI
ncbi:MAG: nucleotidyltransferase domain-containing protein [Phormidesmis sp. CAN_BIN44]|nr:nucleotidyltransferase domain-containing protein [Phormidesmis sp. CAN_BIN44]